MVLDLKNEHKHKEIKFIVNNEMTWSLCDCEEMLLAEIKDDKIKRDSLSFTYAMSICSHENNSINWSKINHTIIERWSKSGLEYIKKKAWKLIKDKRGELNGTRS